MTTSQGYLPQTDQGILDFASNMLNQIQVDPPSLGLVVGQVDSFRPLVTAFAAQMALLNDPNTQTPPNVTDKNTAREALVAGPGGIRELVDIIQAYPGTTDGQRTQLNITIRDTEPTPIGIPATAPILAILSTFGQEITFKLRDPSDPERRGKPEGVAAATVMSFVGDDPPPFAADWTAMGDFTRTNAKAVFSAESVPPGSKVWLAAAWKNPRGQVGPMSTPQSVYLAGGLSFKAA